MEYFPCLKIIALTAGDEVGMFIVEDGNGQWEPDSSEGNYQVIIESSGSDRLWYYSPTAAGRSATPLPVPNARAASSISSGNLQFECRIPFGSEHWQVHLHPDADTCELSLFRKVEASSRARGRWWLTTASAGRNRHLR